MQTKLKAMNLQHGLTLTEILVAVVVLSIGLLGMAGIQMKGLRGTHNTYLRSQATALATDLAERIRANPGGLSADLTNNKNYSDITFNDETTTCDGDAPTSCGSTNGAAVTANCSVAEIAEYDIYTWMCGISSTDGVKNILPDSTVVDTECTTDSDADNTNGCSPGSTVTITLNWNERDTDNVASTQTLRMVVVP